MCLLHVEDIVEVCDTITLHYITLSQRLHHHYCGRVSRHPDQQLTPVHPGGVQLRFLSIQRSSWTHHCDLHLHFGIFSVFNTAEFIPEFVIQYVQCLCRTVLIPEFVIQCIQRS